MAMTWIIDTETVHNWQNRANEWKVYYGDIPERIRRAIDVAHYQHHRYGTDARELAEVLAETFSELELV